MSGGIFLGHCDLSGFGRPARPLLGIVLHNSELITNGPLSATTILLFLQDFV
jgi:hypothetical protein